jgi:hypothetical protein
VSVDFCEPLTQLTGVATCIYLNGVFYVSA